MSESAKKPFIPGFLVKLLDMVNEGIHIKWNEQGTTFIVTNQDKFAREVLPKYFKHSNFTSFIRQLNMYGFHKLMNVKGNKSEFQNEYFQRDHPDLLEHVVRRKHATEENLGFKDILLELQQIKRQQLDINNQLLTIKNESQEIYGNSLALQHQYFKQKDTIDKILQFLAKVYGKNELENISKDFIKAPAEKKMRYLEHEPRIESSIIPLDDSFIDDLPHKSNQVTPSSSTAALAISPITLPQATTTTSQTDLDELFSTQNDVSKSIADQTHLLGHDIDILEDRLFDIQNNLKSAQPNEPELDFDDFFNS